MRREPFRGELRVVRERIEAGEGVRGKWLVVMRYLWKGLVGRGKKERKLIKIGKCDQKMK